MAEPTHIIGTRDTLAIEQSQRIPDVDDKIFLLEPGESPLTAFLTQIGKIGDGGGKFKGMALQKRVVYNPEFTEYEDQYSGVWAQINNGAGYASGAGGGTPAAKGNTPQDNPFDDLVGESINPNKVR